MEIALVVGLCAASIARRLRIRQAGLNVLAAFSMAVFLIHLRYEGLHWQMAPAYLALTWIVGQSLPRPVDRRLRNRDNRARSFYLVPISLCAVTLGLCLALPMFSLPRPSGPFPVGTRTLFMRDGSRYETEMKSADRASKRELMVQVWYPAEASTNPLSAYRPRAETTFWSSYESVLRTNSRLSAPFALQSGPFPVLLFNHGWGNSRTHDQFLTEELASHGYVVAAIDHSYNAGRVAFPDGHIVEGLKGSPVVNPGRASSVATENIWNRELAVWTADQSFVLDSLQAANLDPQSPWYGHLDTHLVGAFGHSFGGSASMQACSLDPRIRSAVNMDGWTFDGVRYRRGDRPILWMYAGANQPDLSALHSSDAGQRVEAEMDVADDAMVRASLQQFGGYWIHIAGATHDDFTDRSMISPFRRITKGGPIATTEMQTIVRSYMLAFFDKTLGGRDSSLLNGAKTSPFPDVKYEQFSTAP